MEPDREGTPSVRELECQFVGAGLSLGETLLASASPGYGDDATPRRAGREAASDPARGAAPQKTRARRRTSGAARAREFMAAARAAASRAGATFAFDELCAHHGFSPGEQDVVWVLLAACSLGDPWVPGRVLLEAVPTGARARLLLAGALGVDGALLAAGIVERDARVPLAATRFRATSDTVDLVLRESEEDAGGEQMRRRRGARARKDRTYLEYLELILDVASAHAVLPPEPTPTSCLPNGVRSYFRAPGADRGEGRFGEDGDDDDDDRLDAPTLEKLERALEVERGSGRWDESPLGRIAARHGLSRAEEEILVYVAFTAPPPDDDDDDELGGRGPFALPHRRSGVSGPLLLRVVGRERAGRWEARRLLYATAPLRTSGLLVVRGGRQDAPETVTFAASEATVRELLGHGDGGSVAGAAAGAAPQASVHGGLLRRVEPALRLDDVVLPADAREAIEVVIAAARRGRGHAAGASLDGRRFRDHGLGIVLTGPPGTGKTLTAESIAGELGVPLLVVDVPTLVSMWVGQTAKNIAQVFRTAARTRGGAVLLFDEADSLFYDRSAAVRTFEARDVNVILTEVERHEGVVVLTTNRRDALDRALSRRAAVVVDLQRPTLAERVSLWHKHLPERALLADDVDVAALAAAGDLTGGEIKKAVADATRRTAHRGEERLAHETLLAAVRVVMAGRWGDEARGRTVGFA
jgi:hypothetical protein